MKTVPINIHHHEEHDMTKQEKKAAALKAKVKNLTDALRRAKAELKAFTAAAKTSLPEPMNTPKKEQD